MVVKLKKMEEYVQDLLDEKITREQLAKKLHIDLRYLSARIANLQDTNPHLYARYIQKYPYKPKKLTHIDYEAVVIEMLKDVLNMRQITEKYKDIGLSEKTLRRRINEMKKTNPNLYWLYKNHALLNRGQIKLTKTKDSKFEEETQKLEKRPVLLGEVTDMRKRELEDLEAQFLELKAKGLSNAETARQMGTTFPILYKQFADLKRIRGEENFRERIKVAKQPEAKRGADNNNPKLKTKKDDEKTI